MFVTAFGKTEARKVPAGWCRTQHTGDRHHVRNSARNVVEENKRHTKHYCETHKTDCSETRKRAERQWAKGVQAASQPDRAAGRAERRAEKSGHCYMGQLTKIYCSDGQRQRRLTLSRASSRANRQIDR